MSGVQNKPYAVKEEPGWKSWCGCGESKTQPYCDNSHCTIDKAKPPITVRIEESKTVFWCGCRRSKTPPYCDGSHKSPA